MQQGNLLIVVKTDIYIYIYVYMFCLCKSGICTIVVVNKIQLADTSPGLPASRQCTCDTPEPIALAAATGSLMKSVDGSLVNLMMLYNP